MRDLPTREDFFEWLEYPCTRALKLMLTKLVEEKKQAWASGAFTERSVEGGALLNAEAIGNVCAWQRVIELTHDELVSELEEE